MIHVSLKFPSRAAPLFVLFICSLTGAKFCHAQSTLAIVEAGVEQSEDSPFVRPSYEFLPGDYLYFTFQIAGFTVRSENRGEIEKISLSYEVTPQDFDGVALTSPRSGSIEAELSSEDKHWQPRRRVSFLIPSFVAAGEFRVHVHVKDVFANTEISQDTPFRIGGVEIPPTNTITVLNFHFYRGEEDVEPLQIPAYSPGDTVCIRFYMIGFKTDPQNQNRYRLSYGLTVLRPDGKTFVDKPNASELEAGSFYPARYLPGVVNLKTPSDAMRGEYVIVLTVRDAIGNATAQFRKAFSIE